MRVNRLVGVVLLGVAVASEAGLAGQAESSAVQAGTLSVGISDTKAPDAGLSAGVREAAKAAPAGEGGRLVLELSPESKLDPKAVGSGQVRVPPPLLRADIAQIPLKKVLLELGCKLGAKVFMAGGMEEAAVTVKFEKLPLEEGIKRMLQGRSYLLVRTKMPAEAGEGAQETRIAEIRVMGKGAGGTSAELKELKVSLAELAELAKQASEAEKSEDRVRALESFANQAEPSALAGVLLPALKDQDPEVRKLALQRMTDAADQPLEPMAEMVLRDDRVGLRRAAIETLVGIHGPASKPILEQALSDPSPAVRRAAQRGLDMIRRLEKRITPKQQ